MRRSAILIALVAILISPIAGAQEYPNRPIRIVEPADAGAAIDTLLHIISRGIMTDWGQPGVIDFRGGAGGIIGTDLVSKAKPDGYTLLVANSGPVGILPNLMTKLPYDAEKDFAPVLPLISFPLVLVVSPNLHVKTVAELISYAKKNPGKLSFSTNGVGQAPHLAVELLKKLSGIDVKIVPYKGSTAALSGLISGTVDAMFIVSPAVIPLLEDKRVQALAITTRERTQFMAGVPTLVESGFPSFQAESWIGILAPAKTPDPVIGKLETEIRKIMQSPAAQDAIKAIQANQMTGTAQEFGVFLTQERTKWGDIIKEANIVIE